MNGIKRYKPPVVTLISHEDMLYIGNVVNVTVTSFVWGQMVTRFITVVIL